LIVAERRRNLLARFTVLDIALLAASAVRILVPLVKRGAEGLAGTLSDRAEEGAAEFAVDVTTSVWQRVREAFRASGQQGAVEEFEKNPDDAQEYLEKLLKRRLEEDEGFARELDELMSQRAPDGRSAVQIMNSSGVAVVSGDVTGGIVAGSIGAIHQSPASGIPLPKDPTAEN
jgi:hypothetical protein